MRVLRRAAALRGSESRRRLRAEPSLHTNHRIDVHPEPGNAGGNVRTPIIAGERVTNGTAFPDNDESRSVRRIKSIGARETPTPVLVRPPARPGSIENSEQGRGGLRCETRAVAANGCAVSASCERVEVPDALILHPSVRADRQTVSWAGAEAREALEDESRRGPRVPTRAGDNEQECDRSSPTASSPGVAIGSNSYHQDATVRRYDAA